MIYHFRCRQCATNFEKLAEAFHPPRPDCPACSSSDVGRVFSAPNVHYVGAGFTKAPSDGPQTVSVNQFGKTVG
ncbi:zinc ribbon domain-containing protein [Candidatus Kaiserbacteria bacterium]|nr:zinc ribbon domain-containing protein [Candidatus Kaiserbacteria bacterium]